MKSKLLLLPLLSLTLTGCSDEPIRYESSLDTMSVEYIDSESKYKVTTDDGIYYVPLSNTEIIVSEEDEVVFLHYKRDTFWSHFFTYDDKLIFYTSLNYQEDN